MVWARVKGLHGKAFTRASNTGYAMWKELQLHEKTVKACMGKCLGNPVLCPPNFESFIHGQIPIKDGMPFKRQTLLVNIQKTATRTQREINYPSQIRTMKKNEHGKMFVLPLHKIFLCP